MTSKLRSLHFIFPVALLFLPGAVVLWAADPPRVAFVTSWFGSGDLSTWTPVGFGADGLDAADWVCQYLAQNAGLDRPQEFVAWLSDSDNDAYCRIHGLTGKKAANCGLTELPSNAGPWVRPDGSPFAEKIYLMLGEMGQVITPPWLDEAGNPIVELPHYYTGTYENGRHDPQGACGDWTSSAAVTVMVGDSRYTTLNWTRDEPRSQLCEGPHRLLCMQTGPGRPLPPRVWAGALAFVTTAGGSGDLSQWLEAGGKQGPAAADNVCRLRAGAAGLPAADSFVALLSDSAFAGGVDAVDRLTLDGPWIRTDGVRVAQSRADLLDGTLFAPVNVDEFGGFHSSYDVTWTGSTVGGLASGEDCGGWMEDTASFQGMLGQVNAAHWAWAEAGSIHCASDPVHLYCFSNAFEILFKDDMESGTMSAWSAWYP